MELEPGYEPLTRESIEWALPIIFSTTTCLLALVYTLVVRPCTSLLFSTYRVRHKVRGYFVLLYEDLLNRMFAHSFTLDIKCQDELLPDENCLVICNHQSLFDYLVLNQVAIDVGLQASCFFYAYKHCSRLFSLRALISMLLRKYDWILPVELLPEVFSAMFESPLRQHGGKWVVLFPEVQMFTLTDLQAQRQTLLKQGCRATTSVLYPRFNAFYDTVQLLRDCCYTSVLNVTISYYNVRNPKRVFRGVPTYLDVLLTCKEWVVQVDIERVPMSVLSYKERRVTKWLERRWYQKDQQLSSMRRR